MPTLSITSSIVLFFIVFCFSSIAAASAAVDARTESNFSRVIQLPTEKTGRNESVCAKFAKPSHCPVNCFRTEPVCGDDGVTYWCGCADAFCHGASVAKLGFCLLGSGDSASVPCQALLLVHIVWLILLGISVLFGLF